MSDYSSYMEQVDRQISDRTNYAFGDPSQRRSPYVLPLKAMLSDPEACAEMLGCKIKRVNATTIDEDGKPVNPNDKYKKKFFGLTVYPTENDDGTVKDDGIMYLADGLEDIDLNLARYVDGHELREAMYRPFKDGNGPKSNHKHAMMELDYLRDLRDEGLNGIHIVGLVTHYKRFIEEGKSGNRKTFGHIEKEIYAMIKECRNSKWSDLFDYYSDKFDYYSDKLGMAFGKPTTKARVPEKESEIAQTIAEQLQEAA